MLEALLAAGADPSRQEKNGRTPSELAESMGYAIPSFQTTLPQSPSSSRAADDFAMIRACIRELRYDAYSASNCNVLDLIEHDLIAGIVLS